MSKIWSTDYCSIFSGKNHAKNGTFFTIFFSAVSVGGLHAQLASKLPNAQEVWDEIVNTYGMDCMEGSTFFKDWRHFYATSVPE